MGGIVGAPVGRVAYSPQEAAALLGVSRATIWADIKSGAIPSTKLGGRRLIPAWAVADLVPGKQPSDHFALEDVAELLGMETDALRQIAGDGPFTRAWFRTHLLAGLETKSGAVWDVIDSYLTRITVPDA